MYRVLIEIEKQSRTGNITTSSLAKPLGYSQQTISRKVRVLESQGFVVRRPKGRGHDIELTDKGKNELRSLYVSLSDLLSKPGRLKFEGILISGAGEGKYYMSLEGYKKPIKRIIGFTPYPGTLNLVIDERELHLIISLKEKSGRINGFRDKSRAYGEIRVKKCMIGKQKGALLFPDRTHHPENVVEIISPFFLRKKLNLEDNDKITIEVEPDG